MTARMTSRRKRGRQGQPPSAGTTSTQSSGSRKFDRSEQRHLEGMNSFVDHPQPLSPWFERTTGSRGTTLLWGCRVVVLMVVQTVASVLTGAQAGQRAGTPGSAVALPPVAVPVPSAGQSSSVDLGNRIIQLAQVWFGVPYLFG